MTAALFALRVATAALVVSFLALLVAWCGPDLEVALFPVLVRQDLVDLARAEGGRAACFTWRFDKVRAARPVDAGWTLRGLDGAIYPFARVRTVADAKSRGEAMVDRPVGAGQWSRKCIDLPPDLVGLPVRVFGTVEYRTATTGRWWTIRQPLAEAEVPAEGPAAVAP